MMQVQQYVPAGVTDPPSFEGGGAVNKGPVPSAPASVDVKKTLDQIIAQMGHRANLLDGEKALLSPAELLAAKGRISPEADAVIDALLSDGNYEKLASSVMEGGLPPGPTNYINPQNQLSLDDLSKASSQAIQGLEKTIASGKPSQLQGVKADFAKWTTQSNEELARSMVKPVGKADQKDVDVVVASLSKTPREVLLAMKSKGYDVYACRDNVESYYDEKTTKPEKWLTYDGDELGTHDGIRNNIAIATTADESGNRVLKYETTPVHEALHAYDDIVGGNSDRAFERAWDGDKPDLKKDPRDDDLHENEEEAYAEVGARYVLGRQYEGQSEYDSLNAFYEKRFTWTEPTAGQLGAAIGSLTELPPHSGGSLSHQGGGEGRIEGHAEAGRIENKRAGKTPS